MVPGRSEGGCQRPAVISLADPRSRWRCNRNPPPATASSSRRGAFLSQTLEGSGEGSVSPSYIPTIRLSTPGTRNPTCPSYRPQFHHDRRLFTGNDRGVYRRRLLPSTAEAFTDLWVATWRLIVTNPSQFSGWATIYTCRSFRGSSRLTRRHEFH